MLYYVIEKEIIGLTKRQIPSNRETQSLLGPDEMSGWPGCRKDRDILDPKGDAFGFFVGQRIKMREPRIYLEGAVYYTTVKAGTGELLFQDKEDYEYFLDILRNRKKKYSFKLYAFCLLANHYHLLIETEDKNISKVMQAINTSYSLYFNKKYHRQGHLTGGRFTMRLLNKDTSLLEVSFYIHLNPVRAGITKTAEYRFSSYPEYIGSIDNTIADYDYIFSFLGTFTNKEEAQKKYQELIKEELLKEPISALGNAEIREIFKTEGIISHHKLEPRILVAVGSGLLLVGLIFFILQAGVLKNNVALRQKDTQVSLQKRNLISLPNGLPAINNHQGEEKQVWEFWKN